MSSALIGHTGFVGGNLAAQHCFDAFFNSSNIEEIAGRSFDFLAISAMPAAMWIANRDPAGDRAVLDRLCGCLGKVKAGRAVLISTIAVYPDARGVDEESAIDTSTQTPYGRHRLMLEKEAARLFPDLLIVRLPSLFGPGLKKNAIYDLLHDNEVYKINAASVYQYYDLNHLWSDIQVGLQGAIPLLNVTTEPLSMQEVAREIFDLDFKNDPGTPPAQYDMRSRHADLFGRQGHYVYGRGQVLDDMRTFVAVERARRAGA